MGGCRAERERFSLRIISHLLTVNPVKALSPKKINTGNYGKAKLSALLTTLQIEF